MNRRRHPPCGSRGFALVDLVIGLALTAMGAGMVAVLVAAATEGSVPTDQSRFDALLVVDEFARDLHESSEVQVVRRRGAVVRSLDLVSATTTVRWTFSGDRLTRQDLSTTLLRVVIDELDRNGAFSLFGVATAPVDIRDPDAVRHCTRLVELSMAGADGGWTIDRAVATRIVSGAAPCP